MRGAEQVTFGGAGLDGAGAPCLDRAANLRKDPEAVARLARDPGARVLPIWRGKPLMDGASAGWLAAGHPVLAEAREPSVFLGLAGGGAHFAADVSAWAPDEEPETLGTFLDPSEQRHPSFTPSQRFAELRAVMTGLSPLEAELLATARAVTGWHAAHGFCAKCGARSAPAMAGWQRDCAACGTHHFPRTDPVVIMLVTHGDRVLLGRSAFWPEGMYSLLAGFVEPGETVEAAVRREVWEESGIRLGQVDYLASQPWPFPASLMLGCRAEALTDAITLDPAELQDACWLSRQEVADVFAGAHPVVKPARSGAIARFLLERWLADRLD